MKACRAAEDDLGALIQRLGQAQAKADAKDGPKEASMAATVIARCR